MAEGSWTTRMRWRARGATQWPAFAFALVVVAALLHWLPMTGDRGMGVFPALLLSGFFCLMVVAVLGPLAAMRLRRRRPGMPKEVADDQASTVLLLALVAVVVVLGVAHRPAIRAARDDRAAQEVAARRFILAHAPGAFHRNVDRLNTWKQAAALYRTCAPGPDPRRAYCVLVNTDQSPPGIVRDPDQRPNDTVAGTDNPGRGPG